jgi:ankyrin repeat protein
MKVPYINQNYNLNSTCFQKKQNTNTIQNTYDLYEYKSYSSQNIKANKFISFGNKFSNTKFEKQTKAKLLNNGYVIAKIEDGKIANNSNKIIIDNAEKLVALSNTPSKWINTEFVLSDNIDLSEIENWKSIGDKSNQFKGIFDGNDYTISNLKINNPDSSNQGLFGISQNANFKNITLSNVNIIAQKQIGALVGYSKNCEFINCSTNGNILGEKKIGGLIGLGSENIIQNSSSDCYIRGQESIGGFIGFDKLSQISNSYSVSNVSGQEEIGGILGYGVNSELSNIYYNGLISGVDKIGGLIGWGDSTDITSSYATFNDSKTRDLIGYKTDCKEINSFIIDSLQSDGSIYTKFNPSIWQIKLGKIPRLKSHIDKMKPEQIFLEDVNIDIKSGMFNIAEKEYFTLKHPKSYPNNKEKLENIKNCSNPKELKKMFGNMVLEMYYSFEDDKNDELLLEIVKNPKFPLNEIYKKPNNDNFSCTPLFILTTLNRAYILREALKRNDIGNIDKPNGLSNQLTIMYRAIDHNLIDCVYVMLSAKNQKFNKDKYKNVYKSEPIEQMFKEYPNIADYENIKAKKYNISQLTSIRDVLTSTDISPNYVDSQGNNIINIAAALNEEEQALPILLNAVHCGTDINNKNNKGITPLENVLENKKYLIALCLLKNGANIDTKNSFGDNALNLFSQIEDEELSINFIDFALEKGISINSQNDLKISPLINSISLQQYKKMKYILSQGANQNLSDAEGQTPLHHACSMQDEESTMFLLENFADIYAKDNNGKTPKDYLRDDKLLKIYEKYENLYKESNILPDSQDYSNQVNCDYNKINSFEDIINEFNYDNNTNLDILSKKLVYLAQNGKYNKDWRDEEGNNLLHIACANKTSFSKELIKIALKDGFDINSRNNSFKTPLIVAIESYLSAQTSKEKIATIGNIKYLMEQKANIELTDCNKQSALHAVCKTNNIFLLKMLLAQDPKINLKDIKDKTPMNYIESDYMKKVIEQYLNGIT